MENNDKNNSFITSLSEIKDESSVQDTPSTAEKNQNHESSQILTPDNLESESHMQIQDYKDESYHYPDQQSNLNDSMIQSNNGENHDQNKQVKVKLIIKVV